MPEHRRHTQIFERPTISPEMRDSLPPVESINSWVEEREESVSPRSDDDTASLPPVREVAFEEPKPGIRETTVEVKKSRAPSWDEILFGGGSVEDEPF